MCRPRLGLTSHVQLSSDHLRLLRFSSHRHRLYCDSALGRSSLIREDGDQSAAAISSCGLRRPATWVEIAEAQRRDLVACGRLDEVQHRRKRSACPGPSRALPYPGDEPTLQIPVIKIHRLPVKRQNS